MLDPGAPMEARFAVFRYYGTFSATLLTMFEVWSSVLARFADVAVPVLFEASMAVLKHIAPRRVCWHCYQQFSPVLLLAPLGQSLPTPMTMNVFNHCAGAFRQLGTPVSSSHRLCQ